MKKLSQNFIWMSAANIVSSIFNGLIFIYLARTLKAEAFGKFSYVQSLVFFLFNFIDLGLSTYGLREIAKKRDEIFEYVKTIVSLRIIIASFLYVICIIILNFVPKGISFKVLMSLMLLMLFSSALATEWAFQGLEKMHMVFISFSLTAILQFVLLTIFVRSPLDLWAAPLVIFLGALPIIIIFLRILKFNLEIKNFNLARIKTYLKSAAIIWAIGLFAQIYNGLDVVILGLFRGVEIVAYFSVARRFIGGIIFFTIFLANAALPRLSSAFKEDLQKFKIATKDFSKLMMILGILLFIPLILFSNQIISLTVGKAYLPASLSFRILVLAACLVLLNLPFSTGLISAGFEKEVLKQAAACAVLNLALNFVLIPKFGMEGAAISFFFTEALGLTLILLAYHRNIRQKIIF
ncbi:MAG: flippase [Candidatus Omnitrophota bacterium]|nr:flippase [Candidatus Omnitrophota bacterium]